MIVGIKFIIKKANFNDNNIEIHAIVKNQNLNLCDESCTQGVSETNKYSSDNCCYLQDFDKLYDRLFACLIFDIHFNTGCYYLDMYFEDFLKMWPF